MDGAPGCGMKAAAGRSFSGPTAARLGVLLCCSLAPHAFLPAAQSPQSNPPTQTPAAQPVPEATTTQQAAQTPSPPPPASSDTTSEVNTHATTPFESRVNLVPVRVVVHDSSGKVVSNLTKEDFRLFQDRRPQTILHFSVETPASIAKQVVRGEAAGEPTDQPNVQGTLALPSRFVALLFDDVLLSTPDLIQARVAAMHYLESSVDPSERVGIFTTSGQSQMDFTDDRAKVGATVTQLIPHYIGTYDPSDTTQCPQMGYYEADLIINQHDFEATKAATADATSCSQSPDPTQGASMLVQSTAQQMVLAGENNTQYAIRRLTEMVRRMSALPGQRTIVFVSPGFIVTSTYQYDLLEVIDKATRANIFINALDARGLYTVDATGDISRPLPRFSNSNAAGQDALYRSQEQSLQSDVLANLSGSTGGFYFHNNNDLGAGFRITTAVPEITYLLAFSPEALKFDGKFHQIKVTLATKEKYTIQARRGFFAPKHAQTPEETAKQDIEEAVFSQEEQLGVPIELKLQYYKSDAVNAKLSVLTRVDVSHVRFEKTDGRNRDQLTVVAALFDRNGNFISGNQEVVDLHLKDATLEKLDHTGMTVKMGFDVKPGGYIVRLVVRDSRAAVLSAKNGVIEIP
jgi:VWFA-related protein